MPTSNFFIQARCESSRFPNKVIRQFTSGLTILDVILNRLFEASTRLQRPVNVYVLSPETPASKQIEHVLKRYTYVKFILGHPTNVLKRFQKAIKMLSLEQERQPIVRICSDNPFIDFVEVFRSIDSYCKTSPGYYQPYFNGTPSTLTYTGLAYELIDTIELLKLKTQMPRAEHVTPDLYSLSSDINCRIRFHDFELVYPTIPRGLRLTIDYERDFWMIDSFLSKFGIPWSVKTGDLVKIISADTKVVEEMTYNSMVAEPKK